MRQESAVRATREMCQLTRRRIRQTAETADSNARIAFDAGIDPLC